jgi:hypothetical protein
MKVEIPIDNPNFMPLNDLPPGGMYFYLLPGGRNFVVTKDYDIETSRGWITIPAGFVTDLASIPKIFWAIVSPLEKHFPAAALHDLFYRIPEARVEWGMTREMTDDMFLEEMSDLDVEWWKKIAMYRIVRLGGNSSWVEPSPISEEKE